METVKIIVRRKNGKTSIGTDRGCMWEFPKNITTETAFASTLFQSVHVYFEELMTFSGDFETEYTISRKDTINKE